MSALPKLELPIHVIKLPVSKKQISFNPFTIKEEKSLVTSLDSNDNTKAIDLFKILIGTCVVTEDFDVQDLNMIDLIYLITYIRMKSVGEVIDGKLECSHCGKKTNFSINLEESMKLENPEVTSVLCKISNDLQLKLVPINVDHLIKEESTALDIFASSIDTVIYKEKIYKDFTEQELKENILSAFSEKEYKIVSEHMDKLVKLYAEFEFVCNHCSEKNIYREDNFLSFF